MDQCTCNIRKILSGTPIELSELPFPVAYPLHWTRDGGLSAADRRANAIFACYQAMRLAALLMLADYLDTEEIAPALAARIRGLRLPHWGEWSLLADELARFWAAPERQQRCRFQSIVEGWISVSRVRVASRGKTPPIEPLWEPLISSFPGHGRAQALSANEALWALRNRRAHGEGTTTPETAVELAVELDRLLPLAEATITRLYGASGLVLLRQLEGTTAPLQVIRLAGPHPDLVFVPESADPEWEDALRPAQVAALSDDEAIPVYPLLIPTEEEPGPTGLVEPVMMIDGVSSTRVNLLGVKRARTITGPHLDAVLAKLRSKQVELTLERQEVKPWKVATWAQMTARQTIDELKGRKYFPSFYLERADIDGRVEQYAAQPGRALLLLGEAGSGKSSLIARLADRLTGGENSTADAVTTVSSEGEAGQDIVVYLTGRADYGGSALVSADRLLAEALARKLGIAEKQFAGLTELVRHLEAAGKDDTQQGRLLWLLLDGVNEADRFADLVRSLDVFLPALAEMPRTRLILSMRSGAFHALASRDALLGAHGPPVFSHSNRLLGFPDAQGREHPWLEVRPFRGNDEGPEAYRLRRESLPMQATQMRYELLATPLRRLLLTPLYLHLYHDTWAGKDVAPIDLDEGQLLDAYLDRLSGAEGWSVAGAGGWIARLGDSMLRSRRAFLPVVEAEEWANEWLAAIGFSSLLAATKLDPVEELVAASVLLRPAETGEGPGRELAGYQFTQQKLAERVLLRALDRRISARQLSVRDKLPSRDELAAWAQRAIEPSPFPELIGALCDWVARLTRAGDGEALTALLEVADKGARQRLIGQVVLALASASEKSANAVMKRLASTASERADGRERFLMSAGEAAFRLDAIGPIWARRCIWQPLVNFSEGLAASDPGNSTLQYVLAISYYQMGDLVLAAGYSAAARQWFSKAVPVAERLIAVEVGNTDFQQFLAKCYGRIGEVAVIQGDGVTAREWSAKALAIVERLAAAHPGSPVLESYLSVSYSQMGAASAASDGAAARQWFAKAASVAERLISVDPDNTEHRRKLLAAYAQMGDAAEDRTAARQWFTKVLDAAEQLVAKDPANVEFLIQLGGSYARLGDLAAQTGDRATANEWVSRAVISAERLGAHDPGNAEIQRELLLSYHRMGKLVMETGDPHAAGEWLSKALTIAEQLVTSDRNNAKFRGDLSSACTNMGDLAMVIGDHARARLCFDKALASAKRLAHSDPTNLGFQVDLSWKYVRMGDLASLRGAGRARQWFGKALAVIEPLANLHPGNLEIQRYLSLAYSRMGALEQRAGQSQLAAEWLNKALAARQRLVSSDPGNLHLQWEVAGSYSLLGAVARASGDETGARDWLVMALGIAEKLTVLDPDNMVFRYGLGASYNGMGMMALAAQDDAAARRWFAKALAVAEQLAGSYPSRTEFQQSLYGAYFWMGELARRAKDRVKAAEFFKKSIAVAEQLAAREPENLVHRDNLAYYRTQMAELAGRTREKSRRPVRGVASTSPN
jgi:tetratricopeptide (TPR) repeat protein